MIDGPMTQSATEHVKAQAVGAHYDTVLRSALRQFFERATLEGYRTERELTAADEALLPLFYTARGFTYLGWVHTRSETETARELTPMLVELSCGVSRRYLGET